ncbi:hypothetical protein QJS04_geneDACA024324 [Acorus gramineus]|uniref:DUF659 domain-containing protein n=1 Tax=Acorus gramineus TaxID=55184 RepID=A0AAV8ZXE2_ACOGR|nr:hypothetical protein QJS04_geneDACA024324 [Acorus gramineus]
MRHHLAKSELKEISPCDAVPGEVHKKALKAVQQLRKESGKKEFISDDRMPPSNSSSCSLTQLDSRSTQRNKKLKTDLSVMNFIYGNELRVLLKDPKFEKMCAAIADAGQGYKPPDFGMDETKMLADLKTEVKGYVQSIKQSWEKFGCTLLLNSSYWIGGSLRRLLLLAACPEGIVYLDSVDHEWDQDDEWELAAARVLSAIDKIIPQNIIQIILGDEEFDWLSEIFSKKREIRSMVTSTKWRDLIQGDEQGVKVQNIIDDNQFWDTGKKLFGVIECAAKIFKVMKGNRSTLGYVHDAFIRLEETVKQFSKENSEIVSSLLDIIPDICEINKMHKAAAYLNPHLYYNGNVKRDNEVQTRIQRSSVQKQLALFMFCIQEFGGRGGEITVFVFDVIAFALVITAEQKRNTMSFLGQPKKKGRS